MLEAPCTCKARYHSAEYPCLTEMRQPGGCNQTWCLLPFGYWKSISQWQQNGVDGKQ